MKDLVIFNHLPTTPISIFQDTSFYPSVDKDTEDYQQGLVVTRTNSVKKEDMSVIHLTLKTVTKVSVSTF